MQIFQELETLLIETIGRDTYNSLI
jgi:heme oxygenase